MSDPALQALSAERDRLRATVESLTELAARDLTADAMMQHAAEHAMRLCGADGAAVELVDGNALEYRYAAGSLAPFTGLRLDRDTSLSGRCLGTRAVQCVADATTDPHVDRAACERVGARSLLIAPLCHTGETLGVLKVVAGRVGAFDETDAYALRLSAALLGSVIGRQRILEENERLFDERTRAWLQATTVFDASPVATVVHDLDGTVRMWNPAATELFGWTEAEVVGAVPPNLGEGGLTRFEQITRRIVDEGPAVGEIVRRPRRDGSWVDVRVSGAPLRDAGGRLIGIVRTMQDVTDQRAHTRALQAAADRLRHVVARSQHAFVSVDANDRVIEWNDAAEAMFGWSRREAILQRLNELIIPEGAREGHLRGLSNYALGAQSAMVGRRVEVMALHRDGRTFPIELSISPSEDAGRPVFDAFIERVGEAHAELDLVRQQALIDPLTGLPNRDYFHASLKAAIDRNRADPNRVAIVIVNLDGFRAINDLFGSATGDALLRAAAERLGATVRDQDTVARLGGDEFAVLLDGLRDARADAPGVAAKLLAGFAEPVTVRTATLPLQASAGVAMHEFGHDDAEVLLHAATEALRCAKRDGGQRVEALPRRGLA